MKWDNFGRAKRAAVAARGPGADCCGRGAARAGSRFGGDLADDAGLILTLDDPRLFRYPVAMMWTQGRLRNLRRLRAGAVEQLRGYRPNYYGIFEDNDPTKRLMLIANRDNDVAEYWAWSEPDCSRSIRRTKRISWA